jgi:DNA-binding MarR family transcriptional regulator
MIAAMDAVKQVLAHYPRIYFACHVRHRREPRSRKVLSERLASVLDHLDLGDGVALKDLAEHMGVTAATMSVTVDRLVAGGWVRRGRDPRDGRKVRLRLTPAGARMKAAQTVLDPDRVRRVLKRLTVAERAAALRGLALLARAAGEEISGSSRGGR